MKGFNKRKENEEIKIDDLFEINSTKVKRTLFKAKIKSIIITTSISIFIITGIYIFLSKLGWHRYYNVRNEVISELTPEFILFNPNKYMGNEKARKGFLSGDISVGTYKIIEGKVVYTGDIEAYYNLKEIRYEGSSGPYGYEWNAEEKSGVSLWSQYSLSNGVKNVSFYNELGQRRMLFYFPFIDYKNLYRDEINKLHQIDDKKVAEMAISFDKYYSVEEVEDMMKGITTTWYWIDILDEKAKEKLIKEEASFDERQYGDTFIKPIMGEDDDDTIGIKLYNGQGQKVQNPIEEFCIQLDKSAKTIKQYEDIKAMLDISVDYGEETKVTYDKSKLRIGGVVVTGTIDQLKLLKGKEFIKASTIGVVTDKF